MGIKTRFKLRVETTSHFGQRAIGDTGSKHGEYFLQCACSTRIVNYVTMPNTIIFNFGMIVKITFVEFDIRVVIFVCDNQNLWDLCEWSKFSL